MRLWNAQMSPVPGDVLFKQNTLTANDFHPSRTFLLFR